MPVQFLSDSDHDRLNRFPEDITQADLDHFFWLSPDDRHAILGLRGDRNQLGFALFLCCLRYLGFFPEHLSKLPCSVVEYVAVQLQMSADTLSFYGKRTSTRAQPPATGTGYFRLPSCIPLRSPGIRAMAVGTGLRT